MMATRKQSLHYNEGDECRTDWYDNKCDSEATFNLWWLKNFGFEDMKMLLQIKGKQKI